ncbi:MAG TPA: hypothetical protein VKT73_12935 [Xanthobacteraceae bacterium]|nr:hypothetical protein [Xanthobacteraceae bacterium]
MGGEYLTDDELARLPELFKHIVFHGRTHQNLMKAPVVDFNEYKKSKARVRELAAAAQKQYAPNWLDGPQHA